MVHGEMDTKNSHRLILWSAPLPRHGRPHPPQVPSLLWHVGAIPMDDPVTFPLQEQAESGLRWPLPGAGKKGVCVKEGKMVDQ